ncbi:hypothetical protein BDF19DRAFT_440709, partial [Syncephalis fuscata]
MTSLLRASGMRTALRMVQRRTLILPSTIRYGPLGSHMSDNDPEIIERELKLQQNEKKVDTYHHMAPGWSETLASESEAEVSHYGDIIAYIVANKRRLLFIRSRLIKHHQNHFRLCKLNPSISYLWM